MAIIKKTFECLDEDIFLNLYKGLVRPQLEYASSVWAPHLSKHIDAIEDVQRRATKIVPGLKDLSYPERLRKLILPTLAYRRLRGDLIQTFKLTHDLVGYDKTLPKFFQESHTSNLRGHSKKLNLSRNNKDIRKYTFRQRVVKLWNALPESVINSKDIIAFENNLDSFWREQPLLYDDYRASIETEGY